MPVLFAALALDALLRAPTLSAAHVGALVVDARTGAVLYEHDADEAFVPASVMKLIVGSAALDRLGQAFSFTTTLSTDGSTLYLRGDGDPLLGPADATAAATAVSALNLSSFPGGLRGDTSWDAGPRYPDGWQVDDLPYDYAAVVSALSFQDNVVHVTVAPGSHQGDEASLTIKPAAAAPFIVNDTTTGPNATKDTVDLATSWNVRALTPPNSLVVTGSIPLGTRAPDELDGSVPHPPLVALGAFRDAFTRAGIRIGGDDSIAPTPPGARVLWQHESPPLTAILGDMWKPSDNLIAETLFHHVGLATERAWLASIGIKPETVTIADGSGMSAYDRVTPRAIVAILRHDWRSPERAIVLAALPVAGESGTLKDRFAGTALDGTVIAKTGTVNHTRTLAGYVETPEGVRIFALLVNDWMDSAPEASKRIYAFQERFLERIRSGASGVP